MIKGDFVICYKGMVILRGLSDVADACGGVRKNM
jgi:hypothetical protein